MKILIIKTGALVDIIGASAVFQTVKENFPEDKIYLLTQEIYKEVVEASPVFTGIFLLPQGCRFFMFLRVFINLRRLKPDIVLDRQGNLKTNFYCFLTGGKKRGLIIADEMKKDIEFAERKGLVKVLRYCNEGEFNPLLAEELIQIKERFSCL